MQAVVFRDTAAAALEVSSRKDPSLAAIASESAGQFYGLQILEKSLEDDPKNYTRFLIIAKKEIAELQQDKCSLILTLKHAPGGLAEFLNIFAEENCNLTKIVSRPDRTKPFEYLFYIDFEFAENLEKIKSLLLTSEELVEQQKILGFYKRGTLWTR